MSKQHSGRGRLRWMGVGSTAALTIIAIQARAQSMDYGALEQVFGESVTTSATGSPQRASDAPVTMEIVTAEEIRRSGAYDIPGVLRHVMGVDFQQWMNDQADIGVRGYDQAMSQRVLVLVDGRQVYVDHYSFTPWSTLPVELNEIRQIEVILGPSSALFGFNAVAGVVNIITYNPLYDEVNAASASGGTQGLAQGSLSTTLRSANAAMRISGGARSDNDFSSSIPFPMRMNDRANENRRSIGLNSALRLSANTQLQLDATRTKARENQINAGYTTDLARYATDSFRVRLSSDMPMGLLQASAYTYGIDQTNTPAAFSAAYTFASRVTVVQLQDLLKVGAQNLFRAALEFRRDTADTTPVGGGRVFYDVASASGMWEWQITPSVWLTHALRFDDLTLGRQGSIPPNYPFQNAQWDRSLQTFSFNSGLVFRAEDRDTLRVTAARGVLIPNLVELGALVEPGPGIGLSGMPTLTPTIVTNYELGWDHTLSFLDARMRARVFYQKTASVRSIIGGLVVTTQVPYIVPADIGNSRAKGLELGFDGKFGPHWRWGLNARLEDVVDSFSPSAKGGAALVNYEDVTPDGIVNAHLGFSTGRWEADTYLRYEAHAGGLFPRAAATQLVQIPARVSADARIGYQLTRQATLAISGQNLTQASQRQTSGPEVERRVVATLTLRF